MKIACDTVIDLISLYKDGTASNTTKELINEHLRDCPECRHYYKCYRNVDYISLKCNNNDSDEETIRSKYENLTKMLHRKKRNGQIINSFISAALVAFTALVCLFAAKRIYKKIEE